MGATGSTAHQKLAMLRDILRDIQSMVLAFSGGVDSTFLLKVASETLGLENILAVTAQSPTYIEEEFEAAQQFARSLGARFQCVDSGETDVAEFSSNPPNRCYYCKKALFSKLAKLAREEGLSAVCDGTNVDDLNDHRPGRLAADELGVRSPLMEAGLTKSEIRELSREMGLSTWDKPALACLASRFPYGTEITTDGLHQVAAAERVLRAHGFNQLRVRHHGTVARIEVSPDQLPRFADRDLGHEIARQLKHLGFVYVTVDLEGYRTGSLNEVLMSEDPGPTDVD